MPPVNGRKWITPSKMAEQILREVGKDKRLSASMRGQLKSNAPDLEASIGEAIFNSNLRYELTLLRLVEKVKDSIGLLAFGPLQVPNAVDVNGMVIKTPVGEIYSLLQDAYTFDFLEMFDEEGEPLPLPPEPGP